MTQTWLSEVFRFTAFFNITEEIESSKWWEYVTGVEPANRSSQPKNKFFQDEGPFEDGRLVLTKQPGRIDWLFFPSFDQQLGMVDLGELRPFDSNKDIFLKTASKWFEFSPSFSRIAFGTTLNIPVTDRHAGYALLSKYLSAVDIDVENSSDLIYQINRRRPSKIIPDLTLNRLSKWFVAVAETSTFPQLNAFDVSVKKETRQFAHVELDINTIQDYKNVLPRDKYYSLFSELVELASEIKEKGDVK